VLPRVAPAAFWFGGWASFAAYAIVVWAFTQAPLALVTALRETSIVFALLIGAFALGERVDARRIAATFVTLCGVALMRLAR
jgi:drug/metabolite transporter (DMT)-like permease